jgi:hypothetical protein
MDLMFSLLVPLLLLSDLAFHARSLKTNRSNLNT